MSLRNLIAGIVAEQIAQMGVSRHATVSAVNPAEGLVKVTYDEGETQSGWLPTAQHAAGNGWGVVTLPVVGTQVFVAPDMGDIRHGVVLGAVHSTQQPIGTITPYMATEGVPLVPGEPTFRHEDGASFRLTATGPESSGLWKHTGDMLVSGAIRDMNATHGSLDDLRHAYNIHFHGGIMRGAANTNTPTSPTS